MRVRDLVRAIVPAIVLRFWRRWDANSKQGRRFNWDGIYENFEDEPVGGDRLAVLDPNFKQLAMIRL